MYRLVQASLGRAARWLGAVGILAVALVFALAVEVNPLTDSAASSGSGLPRIQRIIVHTNRVLLEVTVEPERTYVVQGSEDLEAWTSVSTNRLSASGVIEITGRGLPSRFYRLLRLNEDSRVVAVSIPDGPRAAQGTGHPPTVEMLSPTDGSIFSAPATVLLSAGAVDIDGSIARVEFYEGWRLLGVDASSPYQFTWTNVVAGTHELSAVAIDDLGLRGTSAPVNVSAVSPLQPVEDTHVRGGRNASLNYGSDNPLEIQTANKSADERDGYLKFDLAGVSNVSSATLRLSARLSRSDTVATTVYATETNWQEHAVTWETKPVLGPGLAVANITTTTNAWYEWDVTGHVLSELSSGRSIIALALHNEWSSRTTVLVNSREAPADAPALILTVTNHLPRVAITDPIDGAILEPGTAVLLSSIAETPSGVVSQVEYFDGAASLGAATSSPYTVIWSNATAGAHALTARAVDSRGLMATSSVVQVVFDHPPTVVLTSPTNGSAYVSPAVIPLVAAASDADGEVVRVEFFAGTNRLGTVHSAPYNLAWTNVVGGAYEVVARATDDLGVATWSPSVSLVVHEPPLILSSPESQVAAPGGHASFSVIAGGTPPLSYQWRLNGQGLPGQTGSILVLTNLQDSAFGTVDVLVTNAFGVALSDPASLARSVVVGWGNNTSGQLEVFPWMTNGVVSIDAGFHFNLALLDDGTVKAWGDNTFGQLDLPPGLVDVVAISAGEWHALALGADGTVVGWGNDNFGSATPPEGLTNVVAIETGRSRSVALQGDGAVVAWGWNDFGQSTVPDGLNDVVAISSHGDHTLALRRDGTVAAWGWNEYGQTDVPPGLSNVVAIAAGAFNSLAMKEDGTFVGWGIDPYGMLDVPPGLNHVVEFAMGAGHTVALLGDGTVVRWGGDPNNGSDAAVPGGLTDVVSIQAGHHHSLALVANDGNLLPSVRVTRPVNGETLSGPVDLTMTAEASDGNGSVVQVEFYADGVLLGVDESAPFSLVWSNVVTGAYSLTAKATDDQGGVKESVPVNITVTSFVNTIADAYVRDGAYATGNFGTEPVLEVQTRTIDENRESYFKFDLGDSPGLTGARLRVFGALSGNGSVDAVVYAVADTTWNETSITWETRPTVLDALDTTTVSGRTPGWYEFDVGSFVRAEKAAGRDIISLALRGVDPSRRTIQFHSREALSEPPVLILSNTNKAPTVRIVAPEDNEQVAVGANLLVAAVAADSDGVVAQVEFFVDGQSVHVDVADPFEFVWSTVGEGIHQVAVQATDDLGATSAYDVITVLASTPPQLWLTAPTNNAGYLEPAEIVLQAAATGLPGAIVAMEFFAGSQLVAVATNEPYAATLSNVPAGHYALTARVTDSLGTTTDSDEILVTVFPQAVESGLPGRLAYWRFEDDAWMGEEGQSPLSHTNIAIVSEADRVALEVDSVGEAYLRYRDVEDNRRPNVDVRSGSLVFAFRPNWTSAGLGGGGPGTVGPFFSIGRWTEEASVGCWNLSVSTDGSEVRFVTQTNGFGMTNLVVPVNLSSNVWYQIALTYTPTNSTLYLDGYQVGTNGLGVICHPNALVRARYGLSIGSNHSGTEQVRGRIDDLETFNHALTSTEIAVRPDTDSDGLPDGWETIHGLDPGDALGAGGAAGNPDGDALLNIEEWRLGTDPTHPDVAAGGGGTIRIHTPLE